MRGVAHAERNVRTGIDGRVLRSRNKAVKIKARLIRPVDNFLDGGRLIGHDGLDRMLGAVLHEMAELLPAAAEHCGHALP